MALCTIEETAKVYLEYDPEANEWTLAATTLDGYPLDSALNDVDHDCGGHDDEDAQAEHNALEVAARAISLPTSRELMKMLIRAHYRYDVPDDVKDRGALEAWLADKEER